jgi:branched-chain amino acid transport system ATP-binding protein
LDPEKPIVLNQSMLKVVGLNAYYGQAHILSDLSFDAKAHEVVALVGRNGAGKSTTFKSVVGLLSSKSGSIEFEGNSIADLEPFAIARRGLGYVPEDRRIFSELTVSENLEVGRLACHEGFPKWSVEELFSIFPNLAERRKNPAGSMSGGEQQMLTIARTLMGNPKAILLDEPSEGLAPVIVDKIAETIMSLKQKGMTIVLSEQNMHFASLVADRAYFLEKGRIQFEAPMSLLIADESLSVKYLSL